MKPIFVFVIHLILMIFLSSCGTEPQVMAEQRLFKPIKIEFLSEYQLPKQTFAQTPIGGLSALTYDRQKNRFYALSDDRSRQAPARFYTLKIPITTKEDGQTRIDTVTIEEVTLLKDSSGQNYKSQTIDPEGIALSPRNTVFIASEGVIQRQILPFIGEFDLKNGLIRDKLPIPPYFLPEEAANESPRGVEENLGFESLTISASSTVKDDPFRLFTANEYSLIQDTAETNQGQKPVRWLHYGIDSIGTPVLISEHLYLLDEPPKGAIFNGLTELIALPQESYWLSLERTFGLFGNGAKIFQVVNANASDISNRSSITGDLTDINPLQKKLLLNLSDLNIELDNLEGMTLGPRLSDGSQSLILVSDDNFNSSQVTQFLLFSLKKD
ncbi:MAG TPA: endonuclease/exonuclease/phosphatase [Cyanothece sp. UBA12306]|nr:endonuclease/exonuclease/phosphatase [Cyanothece sp. UBA12306]